MGERDGEFISELDKLFNEMARDDETVTVIITGSEKFFARAQILKKLMAFRTPMEAHLFVSRVQQLFNRIEKLEKPVIAAVSGLVL